MMDEPRRRATLPCPICAKPAQAATHPFCSPRCADIDLGRWFGERYRVPAANEPEPEDPDDAIRTTRLIDP